MVLLELTFNAAELKKMFKFNKIYSKFIIFLFQIYKYSQVCLKKFFFIIISILDKKSFFYFSLDSSCWNNCQNLSLPSTPSPNLLYVGSFVLLSCFYHFLLSDFVKKHMLDIPRVFDQGYTLYVCDLGTVLLLSC